MLSPDLIAATNVALNEADLVSIRPSVSDRTVEVWVRTLNLHANGAPQEDPVFRLCFTDVERIAISLRAGRWDDLDAPVEEVVVEDLDTVVQSFGGLPIYGWEFIDPSDDDWSRWSGRLSADELWGRDEGAHVVSLFQEGHDRHLDVRVWFDDLKILDRVGIVIDSEEFAAGGVRWWDAMYLGDPATHGHGIYPAAPGTTAAGVVAKAGISHGKARWWRRLFG